MKILICGAFQLFLITSVIAQGNNKDSLCIAKLQELDSVISQKLSSSITEQDILEFVNYMWKNAHDAGLQFISGLITPDLDEMNNNPNQAVNEAYITQGFNQLKNKNNVRVESLGKNDCSQNESNSIYAADYKVHFKNTTSFGPDTPNYYEITVYCVNGEFTCLFGILHKI